MGGYFTGTSFDVPRTQRVDPAVDFDWGFGSPVPGVPQDAFSVRWMGDLYAPAPGRYEFRAVHDDGVRLWIDGKCVIDAWVDTSERSSVGSAFLPSGWVPLRFEFYDSSSHAIARLRWSGPGISERPVGSPYARPAPADEVTRRFEPPAVRADSAWVSREPVTLHPDAGGWLRIFDGSDLSGWASAGGRVFVEDGALCLEGGADLHYRAQWRAFVLECEIAGVDVGSEESIAVHLGHSGWGRGGACRVRLAFHGDGDVHAYVSGAVRAWRSGAGAIPLAGWARLRLELGERTVTICHEGKVAGTVDLPGEPAAGGLYFYSASRKQMRIRNVRVLVR
jgi:hypothetical protein